MGKEMRYDIYDLLIVLPKPLAARSLSFEVDERLNGRGEVVTPIRMSDLEALKPKLIETDVEGIAVCFLHSFTNPIHEEAAGAWLREHLPQLSVSLSHEVAPEIREYERMSTTVQRLCATVD
jgi:N-methylhydantoinase A/oxoprolinase/acetone carboxylase beta subunit